MSSETVKFRYIGSDATSFSAVGEVKKGDVFEVPASLAGGFDARSDCERVDSDTPHDISVVPEGRVGSVTGPASGEPEDGPKQFVHQPKTDPAPKAEKAEAPAHEITRTPRTQED